ncbi:MAG: hypothetical protein D3911_03550 [Candidatus Electrothrix sp. AW3_4]|nr:hypothetical protein [Candidatus Electrothrix gigas]
MQKNLLYHKKKQRNIIQWVAVPLAAVFCCGMGNTDALSAPCGAGRTLPANTWLMTAPSCTPSPAGVSDQYATDLNGTYGTDWISFTWNSAPTAQNYVEQAGTDSLVPGTGNWLYSYNTGTLLLDGTATVTEPCSDYGSGLLGNCFAIDLTPSSGSDIWQIIGHPFPYAVSWNDVRVASSDGTTWTQYTPSQAVAINLMAKEYWFWNGNSYNTKDDSTPGSIGALQPQESIWVHIKSGSSSLSAGNFKLLIPAWDMNENALRNGDASLTTETALWNEAKEAIQDYDNKRKRALIDLLKLDSNGNPTTQSFNSIDWNPSHDSVWFDSTQLDKSFPLLVSNDSAKKDTASQKTLAMAGFIGEARFAALGANPFHDLTRTTEPGGSGNEQLSTYLKNLIAWLTQQTDPTTNENLNIVIAHQSDSYWFKHDATTHDWFGTNYPLATINAQDSCESTLLADCLTQADLLVIGRDNGDNDTHGIAFDLDATMQAVQAAQDNGIPVLYVQFDGGQNDLGNALMASFGLATTDNYWQQEMLTSYNPSGLYGQNALSDIEALVDHFINKDFPTDLLDCDASTYNSCTDQGTFGAELGAGADQMRTAIKAADTAGTNLFAADSSRLLKPLVLLGDKYRAGDDQTPAISYPIAQPNPIDQAGLYAFAKAIMADWSVYYTRLINPGQKDLGTFICEKSAVTDGTCQMYDFPATSNGTATESLSDASEWTSTGLYALPGKSITVTRTDSNTAAEAGIFFNFQRVGTSRSVASYDRPQFMQSPIMLMEPGETRTFTSPYGGPIYLRLNGNSTVAGTSVSFNFTGIAKHAAVLDIGDSDQAQAFINDVQTNPLPHVDIRGEGFEAHMRIDKFLNSVNGPISLSQKRDGSRLTIDYSGDVEQLFSDYRDYFVGAVYNLAGFKLPGKTLSNTLSADVQGICQNFGWDCIDETIHRRKQRQHANYDQYANCGSGCSGNPYDAAWNISALGWGDSHELGHNLQTKHLNAHWVTEADRNDWSVYSNRAGENSNNIFPYNTVWNYYRKIQGDDLEITDGHMNHKELFAVIQSDLAGLTQNINGVNKKVIYDEDCNLLGSFDAASSNNRYSVIWENSAYAADNGMRMSFLLQLPVMLDKQTMRDGTILENGMDIFTLLYSQSRLFAQAANNETDWNSARDGLGFGLFPYEGGGPYGGLRVKNIPGNDFLLVALGFITGKDWRTYFDLRGVRYSDLAAQQVEKHTTDSIITSAVGTEFAVLDTELPTLDMSTVPYVNLDGVSTWPKDGWHPSQCLPTP